MNTVLLAGRIGQLHELREAGRSQVLTLTLATSRRVKQGETWSDETTWHSLKVWGRQAEFLAADAGPGFGLTIQGRLQLESWEDKDGNPRERWWVVVEDYQLGAAPRGKGSSSGSGSSSQQTREPSAPASSKSSKYNNPQQRWEDDEHGRPRKVGGGR